MSGYKVFNRDVDLAGNSRLMKGTTVLIDEDGNIDAPVTTTNMTATGDITLGDAGTDTLTVNAKLVDTLYWNASGSSNGAIKAHKHLTTSDYVVQLRSESIATSGTHWGIDSETHLSADGSCSIRGVQGVALVATGFTATGSTLIGTYGQARADGTMAGSGFMAGLYGLIEASAAITASHVCSAWLDSHQANAVTGSHQLLYMTNNGAAQMDEVMYIYGGDKTTAFVKFDTCSGMVADTAETGGSSKKIKIDIDGTVHYLNAYTG